MRAVNALPPEQCDVVVVGGGPSGLAAGTELKKLGIENVVILERELSAGGIPRHCGHSPFGMREFTRCYRGSTYARKLVECAQQHGVTLFTNTTVTSVAAGGILTLTNEQGVRQIHAKKVVLSTGARETPRSSRLISGQRPLGITTTGALQSMVYLKKNIPFKHPIIIGTELVSFSALLTCRHADIRPVAILESNRRITAWTASKVLPRLLDIPLLLNTHVEEILGKERVSGVKTTNTEGQSRIIKCDGIVFTGQFTPEHSLTRMSHLKMDSRTGGPIVDQFGRCSDPSYFATGNLLRPIETAGWCWQEGRQAGRHVAYAIKGELPNPDSQTPITLIHPAIKYVVPQILSFTENCRSQIELNPLQVRVLEPMNGRLSLTSLSGECCSKRVRALPERRILCPVSNLQQSAQMDELQMTFIK